MNPARPISKDELAPAPAAFGHRQAHLDVAPVTSVHLPFSMTACLPLFPYPSIDALRSVPPWPNRAFPRRPIPREPSRST